MTELKPTAKDIEEAEAQANKRVPKHESIHTWNWESAKQIYLAGILSERKCGYEEKAKLQAENDKLRISAAGLDEILERLRTIQQRSFNFHHDISQDVHVLDHYLRKYRKSTGESDTKNE